MRLSTTLKVAVCAIVVCGGVAWFALDRGIPAEVWIRPESITAGADTFEAPNGAPTGWRVFWRVVVDDIDCDLICECEPTFVSRLLGAVGLPSKTSRAAFREAEGERLAEGVRWSRFTFRFTEP